ncbi:hypothetical protein JEQ12_009611 [Ovis aries]|uniref:Uncharacterized protein n=1 Tax=Ovis aries TaxID=9940 RepID=A0A836AMN1_SHEEP|nr:hypothetical protein JEQ12_009611 [Ovis aries]
MAPARKGGEKKQCWSTINEVMIREYTINIYKSIHGVEIWKFAMKEMGKLDVSINTRSVPCRICVQLCRKCNGDKDSTKKPFNVDEK